MTMKPLDDLIFKILTPRTNEIRQCIVDTLLRETITVVCHCIYSEAMAGKIKFHGLLDEKHIFTQVIDYFNLKPRACAPEQISSLKIKEHVLVELLESVVDSVIEFARQGDGVETLKERVVKKFSKKELRDGS